MDFRLKIFTKSIAPEIRFDLVPCSLASKPSLFKTNQKPSFCRNNNYPCCKLEKVKGDSNTGINTEKHFIAKGAILWPL